MIYEKFDIFYYLNRDKKFEIFQLMMYNDEIRRLIDLISKKNYKLNQNKIEEKEDELENEDFERILLGEEKELNLMERRIIEIFNN